MTYTYPLVSGDLIVMALKIEKQLPLPDGWGDSGGQTYITYNTPLTAPQKSTLDSIVSNATVGSVPMTANTVYSLDDIMDLRKTLTTQLATFGITFSIYPSGPSQMKLVFDKVLTTSDKNNLKNVIAGYFKQVQ
jgi:hypothetical protein